MTDRALLKTLEDAFSKATDERPRRPLHGPNFESSGWIAYEREQMLAEVNKLRALAGKAPVPTEEFVKTEALLRGAPVGEGLNRMSDEEDTMIPKDARVNKKCQCGKDAILEMEMWMREGAWCSEHLPSSLRQYLDQ